MEMSQNTLTSVAFVDCDSVLTERYVYQVEILLLFSIVHAVQNMILQQIFDGNVLQSMRTWQTTTTTVVNQITYYCLACNDACDRTSTISTLIANLTRHKQ